MWLIFETKAEADAFNSRMTQAMKFRGFRIDTYGEVLEHVHGGRWAIKIKPHCDPVLTSAERRALVETASLTERIEFPKFNPKGERLNPRLPSRAKQIAWATAAAAAAGSAFYYLA